MPRAEVDDRYLDTPFTNYLAPSDRVAQEAFAIIREAMRKKGDDALAKLKRKRTIALVTPRFLSAPFIVQRAPVLATMPSKLARFFAETLGLSISPPPVKLPTFAISLLWHASYDHDPGHSWLRETIRHLTAQADVL